MITAPVGLPGRIHFAVCVFAHCWNYFGVWQPQWELQWSFESRTCVHPAECCSGGIDALLATAESARHVAGLAFLAASQLAVAIIDACQLDAQCPAPISVRVSRRCPLEPGAKVIFQETPILRRTHIYLRTTAMSVCGSVIAGACGELGQRTAHWPRSCGCSGRHPGMF